MASLVFPLASGRYVNRRQAAASWPLVSNLPAVARQVPTSDLSDAMVSYESDELSPGLKRVKVQINANNYRGNPIDGLVRLLPGIKNDYGDGELWQVRKTSAGRLRRTFFSARGYDSLYDRRPAAG